MDTNSILGNINIIADKMLKSVETQVYPLLDQILDIKSDILNMEPISKIFNSSGANGIVIIANSFIIFFTIYYIYEQVIGLYNGSKVDNIFLFIIKMVVIIILVNNSYYICSQILDLFTTFSETFDIFIDNVIGKKANFDTLKSVIISTKSSFDNDFLSMEGIISGIISFGSVSILINLSIRYITIIFLVIISPIAIVCMSSRLTKEFSKTWIKLLITNLFLQIIIKLIILIPSSFENTGEYIHKVLLVGCVYLLYRVNVFSKELMGKFVSNNRGIA